MPTVTVSRPQGNVEVGYAIDGAGGPPILLLHGTTSSRVSWDTVVPDLSQRHIVVRTEFPGSGETPLTDEPLQVEELARQAIGAMHELGYDRFHVAGWSLGGVIAMGVAALAPESVESLTVVAGWLKTDARMRFTFDLWSHLIASDPELFAEYAIADGFTAATFEIFGVGINDLVPLMAAGVASGSHAQLDLDKRVDITDLVASITAPTLVVGGLEDRWVDITHSRAVNEAISESSLVELPVGHLIPQEQAGPLAVLLAHHMATSAQ